jgi:hypothetical protein
MIGILALLAFSTYVGIACWSTLLFDSRRARVAVVCFWLLVPSGDALVGRLWLLFKCHQGAVLQISQTVPPVEVVFVRKEIDEYSPQTFGYHSVEGTPRQNVGRVQDPSLFVRRVTTLPNYAVQITELSRRTAKFGLFEADIEMDAWLKQTLVTVERLDTFEVLGHFSWYTFHGGWIEGILGSSPQIQCSRNEKYQELVRQLLHGTVPAR